MVKRMLLVNAPKDTIEDLLQENYIIISEYDYQIWEEYMEAKERKDSDTVNYYYVIIY